MHLLLQGATPGNNYTVIAMAGQIKAFDSSRRENAEVTIWERSYAPFGTELVSSTRIVHAM